MPRARSLPLALVLVACAALAGCGDGAPASGSGAPSATPTSKPATIATSAAPTAAPAVATSAAPTATPAPTAVAIQGIKPGETLGGSCDTISQDSECGEFMVTGEGQEGKAMEALKKLCKGTVSEKQCPADRMVGSCRVGKDIINHYYGDGPKSYKSADDAKKACEKGHGRWVTP